MITVLIILIALVFLAAAIALWRTTSSVPRNEAKSDEEGSERIVDVAPPGSGP